MDQLIAPTPWQSPLSAYLAALDAARMPEGTRYLRSYHLRRFAADTRVGPWDVTEETIEDHIRDPDWSANTARSVLTTLKSFYKWAHRKGHIPVDPTGDIIVRAELGHPRPAPEDVVMGGLRTADTRTRLMIELAAWVGLRCCEIAVIRSDDAIRTADGWELRVHGKGRKVRFVPAPERIGRRIAAADGYLFPGDKDGHLSAHYVSKLISRALPDGFTAHMLRHRFASAAYLADHDIRAVQELLGHASVATTQIYTAIPRDNLRRAADHAYRLAS